MKVGRRLSPDAIYARELGVSKQVVRSAGGAERLKTLDPDVRAILLSPFKYGNSRTVHDGGLAARGMKPRQRGLVTQLEKKHLIPPLVEFDVPLEALLRDEDALVFEGLGELDG